MAKSVSLPSLLKKTQQVFNAWIRERDKGNPCISCGTAAIEHAGHYFSAGHHSALRFSESNVHGQCLRCNYFLSGNQLGYRNGLLKKIGEKNLLLLESAARRSVKKWTRTELLAIIEHYKISKKAA